MRTIACHPGDQSSPCPSPSTWDCFFSHVVAHTHREACEHEHEQEHDQIGKAYVRIILLVSLNRDKPSNNLNRINFLIRSLLMMHRSQNSVIGKSIVALSGACYQLIYLTLRKPIGWLKLCLRGIAQWVTCIRQFSCRRSPSKTFTSLICGGRIGREERLEGCRVGQKGEKEERKRDEGIDGRRSSSKKLRWESGNIKSYEWERNESVIKWSRVFSQRYANGLGIDGTVK